MLKNASQHNRFEYYLLMRKRGDTDSCIESYSNIYIHAISNIQAIKLYQWANDKTLQKKRKYKFEVLYQLPKLIIVGKCQHERERERIES